MLVSLTTVGATGELPGGDELTGPALEVNRDVKTVSAVHTCPPSVLATHTHAHAHARPVVSRAR